MLPNEAWKQIMLAISLLMIRNNSLFPEEYTVLKGGSKCCGRNQETFPFKEGLLEIES